VVEAGSSVAVEAGSSVAVETGSSVAVETGSSVAVETGSSVVVETESAAEPGPSAERRWRSVEEKGLCCCFAGPDQGLAPEVTGLLACSDWIPVASVL